MASHGRGGAGNMAESSKSPRIQASDLETPVLKTAMVTTGREVLETWPKTQIQQRLD